MDLGVGAYGSHRQAISENIVFAGQPYKDTKDTLFADLMQRGCLGVVKGSYFAKCFADDAPFMDRENIAPECFVQQDELIDMWQKHGAKFLVIVSYPWLTKSHPDPNKFHLKRLARVLQELKAYHKMDELGVILDFCALWQKHAEDETRTHFQVQQFKAGLQEINTPYGHQEITSVKMIKVPADVPWP